MVEHLLAAGLNELDVGGLGLQGTWQKSSAQWSLSGTPGELRRMVSLLSKPFLDELQISNETIAAQVSRLRLEAQHVRGDGSWQGVHHLLSGEPLTLQLPDVFDEDVWTRVLQEVVRNWIRPERSTILVASPFNMGQASRYVSLGLKNLPPADAIALPFEVIPDAPPPRTIRHTHTSQAPVPTVYAWEASYLEAYRGRLSLLIQVAHAELLRLTERSGIAYGRAVGPSAHHVWGAVWSAPERTSEAVETIRQAFANALETLSRPDELCIAKKRLARVQFTQRCASPRAVVDGLPWLQQLYPMVPDPLVAHLRSIAQITIDEIGELVEKYKDESRLTTVEYIRAN